MKICILTHSFPRFLGDTATPFMGNLARALGEGHQVFVLTPFDTKLQTQKRGPFKVISFRYAFPNSLNVLGYARTFKEGKHLNLLTYFLSPLLYLFGFIALFRLVKKEKIDVVSAHWIIPNGFIAALVKITTGVPITSSIPGADMHMGGQNELFRQMVGFSAKLADHIISDSSHYIDQLNELGYHPKNVSIIRYGVDTQVFKPLERDKSLLKQLRIDPREKVILAVGRMVVQKGFIYLVDAFADVLKIIPNSKLVLIGDGYERSILEKRASQKNITDRIIFAGTISYDQLINFYNLADVFVMPSIKDSEGNLDASPVAMMEAMACGVPVVATRFSGNEDLIRNGETGYLVKEKNALEIAKAIKKILNEQVRLKTQTKVRQIAVDNFSIKTIAGKYIEIFEKIIH